MARSCETTAPARAAYLESSGTARQLLSHEASEGEWVNVVFSHAPDVDDLASAVEFAGAICKALAMKEAPPSAS